MSILPLIYLRYAEICLFTDGWMDYDSNAIKSAPGFAQSLLNSMNQLIFPESRELFAELSNFHNYLLTYTYLL